MQVESIMYWLGALNLNRQTMNHYSTVCVIFTVSIILQINEYFVYHIRQNTIFLPVQFLLRFDVLTETSPVSFISSFVTSVIFQVTNPLLRCALCLSVSFLPTRARSDSDHTYTAENGPQNAHVRTKWN
jgi:hypothetical protein